MSLVEVKVPDIGDFKDVDVIEVNIKAGDVIEKEQSLLTLESDKASMEVPSDAAGTVKEVRIKAGDKVSQGTVIALVEVSVGAGAAKPAPAAQSHAPAAAPAPARAEPPRSQPAAAPAAASYTGNVDIECDMVVLGAGPGGYSAAFRSADLGMKTVLVERYPTLGGVCLNVGCIPSKALLHTALIMDEVGELAEHGIMFGEAKIDLPKLRSFKSGVVKKLTTGLAGMAKARKVEVVTGVGSFLDPHHMEVQGESGKRVVRFKQAIVAAGSQAVKLPFMPDDPRVIDSTGALELPQIPQRMLVVGGGIIGLEMATVYATLGAKIDVVEMLDGLMLGADRDLVKVWQKYSARHFANVMLKTKTTSAEAKSDGIYVKFEGESAPAQAQRYDLVLVAVGRSPNGKKIGADNAGIAVTDRGFIEVDKQMRTNVPHIFAIGDIVGQPMLAHKAVHEGHVAAEAAHGEKAYFDALQIPSVAYTDPEVAWAGKTEDQCKAEGIKFGKAVFPWAASGRAIANGRDEGFTKLIFDEETHRVIGGGIVGLNAGDLISEVCLAIEMGADATDIGRTIHPHPTLGESIGMAAELYEGVCTDLPPQRKK
ncbi:dihydrolipoamide dehydrogenase [Trinickia symbiotica]|uniref:Dihydrolipoyl dehydrogenase n=1 Tax=Trinickia symbiotica TaxID=863227 RepID=A0A2N7WX95_9BURK|nr:dihydrolipoyl dehydrogenase [Trinickia symbiotica]PMS33932.1 dihydrolipoyl dehydrogenase [Trinickia symbiotica]PPK42545.1 dihydrolipoamide dehydrogenase [Trinickia symbiotica]